MQSWKEGFISAFSFPKHPRSTGSEAWNLFLCIPAKATAAPVCLEKRGRAMVNLEIIEELLPNAMAWAEGSLKTAGEVFRGLEKS